VLAFKSLPLQHFDRAAEAPPQPGYMLCQKKPLDCSEQPMVPTSRHDSNARHQIGERQISDSLDGIELHCHLDQQLTSSDKVARGKCPHLSSPLV